MFLAVVGEGIAERSMLSNKDSQKVLKTQTVVLSMTCYEDEKTIVMEPAMVISTYFNYAILAILVDTISIIIPCLLSPLRMLNNILRLNTHIPNSKTVDT